MASDDDKISTNASGNSIESGDAKNDDVTRREVVKSAWVAPVFVAVNLPKGAFAQNAVSPVATPGPTSAPTWGPTGAPAST